MDDKSRSRLAATLEKVITTEISLRTGDLNLVEQNINTVREYLNKLRQGVCAEYYDDNFKTTLQKPPHRAVKNTFKGKTPIKREAVDSSEDSASTSYDARARVRTSRRQSLDEAFSEVTIKEEPADDYADGSNAVVPKDRPQLKYVDPEEKQRLSQEAEKRRPRYIPPVLPIDQIQQSLEPRGNKLMKKVRFLVRNNSKYIMTPEDSSGCTYKWSLNVKLNDESCDISDIVSKVIFYLHPSYKPNDVITLTSAPFKITRRGWGEFNLRVKIFFKNEKNEPVDILHQLVFDKLCSGIETFGGETVFDHWINDPAAWKQSSAARYDSPKLAANSSQRIDPPKKSPTIMNTDESSSSLLSAFFGELEDQTAKKDSEWGQDIFELSNLAFPEFFSSPGKPPAENVTSEVVAAPVGVPDNLISGNECVATAQAGDAADAAAVTEVPPEKIEVQVVHESSIVEDQVLDNSCEPSEEQADDSHQAHQVEQHQTADVLQPVESRSVETAQEEIYLSDLSMFDDVVISESADSGGSGNSVDRVEQNCVDYNSVEMDDLIHFRGKGRKNVRSVATASSLAPVNSTENTSQPLLVTDAKQNISQPVIVNDVKQITVRKSVGKKTTPKNSPLKTTSAPKQLVKSPPTKVHMPTHLRPIAPSLPGRLPVPLSTVLANLPPPANKSNVVYVVAPSGSTKLSPNQAVPPQVVSKGIMSRPQTVFVSSSELPNMIASQSCTPTLVMTSPRGARAPSVQRNAKKSLVATSLPVGSPQSVLPNQSPKPILVKADGKPMPLVNVASLSTAVPKPSILVQTPRASSQATTAVVPPKLSPTGTPPVRHLTPQIRPNLTPTPRSKAILVRPGGTQFLLKMPDGSLKPIRMESLKPLQQGNIRLRIAPTPSIRSEQRLPAPVSPTAQKRRPALLRPSPPVKKARLPPESFLALAGPSKPLVASPSSSSHQPNQLTKPQPRTVPPRPTENCQDDPEPGMHSLKRRPPETEVDTSSFRDERLLIEQCPKESAQLAFAFLLKKLPLVDARAQLEVYKQAFPYCAPDRRTFQSWPVAKQRAHEVLRANDVLSLAKRALVSCNWTKWDIVRLARMRGFTPLTRKIDPSFLPHKPMEVLDPPTDADFSSLKALFEPEKELDEEVDVDDVVEDLDVPEPRVSPAFEKLDKKGKVFMTLAKHVGDGGIVENWVRDVSIYLDPEEVAPGILFPAALRLLVSSFHSFAEDLLRRSYSSAFLRYDSRTPRAVTTQDVRLALRSRPEFDLFTNVGLGTKYRQARRRQLVDPKEEDRRLRNAEKVS